MQMFIFFKYIKIKQKKFIIRLYKIITKIYKILHVNEKILYTYMCYIIYFEGRIMDRNEKKLK